MAKTRFVNTRQGLRAPVNEKYFKLPNAAENSNLLMIHLKCLVILAWEVAIRSIKISVGWKDLAQQSRVQQKLFKNEREKNLEGSLSFFKAGDFFFFFLATSHILGCSNLLIHTSEINRQTKDKNGDRKKK